MKLSEGWILACDAGCSGHLGISSPCDSSSHPGDNGGDMNILHGNRTGLCEAGSKKLLTVLWTQRKGEK